MEAGRSAGVDGAEDGVGFARLAEHHRGMPASTFVAREPADLIALAPSVLGFVPSQSVVLMTFGQPARSFHARIDLPSEADAQVEVAEVLISAMERNRLRRCAVLIYSTDHESSQTQGQRLVSRAASARVEVIAVLRIAEGRYFHVMEGDRHGVAVDAASHPFAVQRVVEGAVVFPSREALASTLDPIDDPSDGQMIASAAVRTIGRWGLRPTRELSPDARRALRAEAAHLDALVRSEIVSPLKPESLGRILGAISHPLVRDVAMVHISSATAARHIELWRDAIRRAPTELLAPAAALLAFAAWQNGDGALAWCAIDRCVAACPKYLLAEMLAGALSEAVPPNAWRGMASDELEVFSPEFLDPAA